LYSFLSSTYISRDMARGRLTSSSVAFTTTATAGPSLFDGDRTASSTTPRCAADIGFKMFWENRVYCRQCSA
jgi:hypothetical protein